MELARLIFFREFPSLMCDLYLGASYFRAASYFWEGVYFKLLSIVILDFLRNFPTWRDEIFTTNSFRRAFVADVVTKDFLVITE